MTFPLPSPWITVIEKWPVALKLLISLDSRHKKRRPWTSFFVELVGRGNLNSYLILLIFIANIWFCFSLEYHLEYLAKLHANRPRA